jgi:hypothetical protein
VSSKTELGQHRNYGPSTGTARGDSRQGPLPGIPAIPGGVCTCRTTTDRVQSPKGAVRSPTRYYSAGRLYPPGAVPDGEGPFRPEVSALDV